MTIKSYETSGASMNYIIGPNSGETGPRVFIGPTDPISDIPVVMEFTHHQNHEGEMFHFQYVDAALDTSTVKFALVVPTYSNTLYGPHLLLNTYVYNGAARVDIYEGGTYSGGSLMSTFCGNRNTTGTAGMQVYQTVTSTNGTLLPFSFFAGAGTRGGGESRGDNEIILKSNTTYRVDFTGLVAGTDGILHFEWYEDLGV